MEELIRGPFAQALDAGRPRYNALFAQARQAAPRLEPAAFAGFLRETVAPIVDAVAQAAPGKVQETSDALYEMAIELVAHDFPTRYPAILEGWHRLLGGLPRHLAAAPGLFAGSVTNALYNLSVAPGARPQEWVAGIRGLGEMCDNPTTLLEAGKVAAWRAGLAHYRESALDACARLDPMLASGALGIGDPGEDPPLGRILEGLRANPWARPEDLLRPPAREPDLDVAARVGGFRGFGGPFLRPPTVASSGGTLYVSDGEACWCLTADAFGATLHRAGEKLPSPGDGHEPHFRVERNGKVSRGPHTQTFAGLEGWTSLAATPSTLAATIPLSHLVFLIALR